MICPDPFSELEGYLGTDKNLRRYTLAGTGEVESKIVIEGGKLIKPIKILSSERKIIKF